MRIGVFGHVGNGNLGDEALITAVIQNVRRRYPDAELRGFTRRPQDTEQRHRIPAFPIHRLNGSPATASPSADQGSDSSLRSHLKRVPVLRALVQAARRVLRTAVAVPLELAFLARSYRNLRGTDLLLVAGSQQLNDYWGGPWSVPFTLFKWSVLARATGTKVVLLSTGAGPLRTRLGKFFIKQTLRLSHYRSYRDDDARHCVLALGASGEHPVVPDLVFSLQVAPPRGIAVRSRRRVVGINPMPCFDDAYWPESDRRLFAHYQRVLASFADWLVESEYDVRFFATQLAVDHGVIDDVRGLMKSANGAAGAGRVVADPIRSFDELVSVIDGVDLVVATRYHGTVFSLIRQKPVLSIAYHRKSVELMQQMGQAQYAIDIGQLSLAALGERFLALERHADEFAAAVGQRLPQLRTALDAQYDRSFALLGKRFVKGVSRECYSEGRRARRTPEAVGGTGNAPRLT